MSDVICAFCKEVISIESAYLGVALDGLTPIAICKACFPAYRAQNPILLREDIEELSE